MGITVFMLSILKVFFFLYKIVSILSSFRPQTLIIFNNLSLFTSMFTFFYDQKYLIIININIKIGIILNQIFYFAVILNQIFYIAVILN
jgi:hypothetical protein